MKCDGNEGRERRGCGWESVCSHCVISSSLKINKFKGTTLGVGKKGKERDLVYLHQLFDFQSNIGIASLVH